ncbi:universal stress protein [Pseudonocardia endophytica]|uniref:Nucleotide-binding universal stress UspA family protein n=1 Tax=Pseudonocardia endophytica TaxID=401976 RepID=A0A4R1HMH6_PSEEN|nr:universal stress protein [Pseudonocardia endophytica]TCK22341.1 nucleotide-binding universal stress UspA family protein [Pseudonocardia endophytica]
MDAQAEWPILVGVDGSDTALDAARWAAGEAGRRGLRLRLLAVTAWTVYQPAPEMLGPDTAREVAPRFAAEHLARARTEAARTLPDDRIDQDVHSGYPAEVLREESARAALLVVGNRGRGGFTGLLAGSVSTTLAATSACPVVIHRGSATPDGPVVVGVPRSADGDGALGFAFEEARLRGADLVAVHAWSDAFFDPDLAALVDRAAIELREAAALADALASWQEKYPEVTVLPRLAADPPAAALVRESDGAQLVVVGSRGRGAVAGLLLGSVGRATVHHAHCPVAIVRPAGEPPAEV